MLLPTHLFTLLLLASPGAAHAWDDQALLDGLHLPVREETLDNGLRVVVSPDHRAPVFALHIQTAAGAANDLAPPGGGPARPGLAHLVEHLLFAGSPRAPHGAYDALLSAAGGENNAWTEHDAMAVHMVAPVEALDLALALEADRLAALDRESVAARLDVERAVVERERAIDRDSPGGLDLAALRAALYPPGHPDAGSVAGSASALAEVTVDEVLAFHAGAWAPGNAVLVLVGDVDPDDALARIRAHFAPVPARPATPAPDGTEDRSGSSQPLPEPVVGERALHLDDVDAVSLFAAWPLPTAEHPDAPALALLADVLAMRRHGRLGRRVERGRLDRAEAWTAHDRRGGRFVLRTSDERPAPRQLREVDRALAGLAQDPPTAAELERSKARWRSWAARALEDPQERAEILAGCVLERGRADCFADHVARHLSVTGDALPDVAARWLQPDRRLLLSVTSPGHADQALPDSTLVQLDDALEAPAAVLSVDSPAPVQPPDFGVDPDPLAPAAAPLPVPGPPAPWTPPTPRLLQLDSGVPVWFLPRPEVPLVRIAISLRRGLLHAADPLALLHAGALLDEGTRTRDALAWADALDAVGAQAMLGAGMARGQGEVEAPVGEEAQALALLVEALTQPAMPRRAFRRVRKQAVQAADDAWLIPGTLHAMAVQRALYPADHPLGRVWQARDHRRVRRAQLRRAWREELALGSPAVVVVGDTTEERLLPMLETALADLPAVGEPPDPLPRLAPPAPGPRRLLVDMPGLERVFVSVLLPVPGAFSPREAELELLHRALSAEFDSRMSRLLRETHGWTYGVHGLLRVWPGHGVMEIRFAVPREVLPDALAAVEAELERVVAEPPADQERLSAFGALRRELALRQLRLSRATHNLAVLQGWEGQPDHDARLLAAAAELTDEALAGAVRSLLDPATAVWVMTGDRASIEPMLDDAGVPLDAVRTAPAIVDGTPPLPL